MRLTDRCTIRRNGAQVGEPVRCSFGHVGGERPFDAMWPTKYKETARVIVGPLAYLAAITTPAGWTVLHHGNEYKITAVLPRFRSHGRLHHVSLDLEAVT